MSPEALIFPISHFLKDLTHSALLRTSKFSIKTLESRVHIRPELHAFSEIEIRFDRAPSGPARPPFLDTIAPGMLKGQAGAGFTSGQ